MHLQISRDPLRRGLIDDTVMHQRVTCVPSYDNVANCTQWRACLRSLFSSCKNSSAIRSQDEEKAFIDRLSSLGSVLLFPSSIPLKAELIGDSRAYARKMERPWSRWFFAQGSFRPRYSAQMTRHSSMILMRLPSVITHTRYACKWNVNSGYLMPQDGDR